MSDTARQTRNLHRLLDVTRQMAAITDLTKLLGVIVDAACDVLGCERATIFLYDRKSHELYSIVATGVEGIRFSADRGIAGAAASQRAVINVPDAYADPRFNPDVDRRTGFRTRNLLTFPLENLAGELMGVLQALNHADGPFTEEQAELARVLAAQAGVALHRQFLLEEQVVKQRMARDLELARKIQLDTLPKVCPQIPGYEIAGWNRPADETGGDTYDFQPLGGGQTAVILADATGHGIGAALVIAQCRSMARAMLSMTSELGTIALRVNNLLIQDISADRFVTAFIGVLDPSRHVLSYISAGQGPLIFISRGAARMEGSSGLPLAVLDDATWTPERFTFEPGDMAVLLTDGFFETSRDDGEQFGEPRVIEILARHAGEPLAQLIERLDAATSEFRGSAPQHDDLTAVLIRRKM